MRPMRVGGKRDNRRLLLISASCHKLFVRLGHHLYFSKTNTVESTDAMGLVQHPTFYLPLGDLIVHGRRGHIDALSRE